MKKITLVLAMLCFPSMPMLAQDGTDTVARLSADDYTSFLLGEYELPEHQVIATLADSKESSDRMVRSSGNYSFFPENLTPVALAPAEAHAMAVQIYFKFVEDNVSRLGYQNALRLAMGELGLSEAEARGFIDFATASVKEYENLLVETNIENCENFNDQLSTSTKLNAVQEMAQAESQLNSLVIQYYDGITSRLDNSLGVSVYNNMSEHVGHLASSLKTVSREIVSYAPSEIDSSVARYTAMCERFGSLQ